MIPLRSDDLVLGIDPGTAASFALVFADGTLFDAGDLPPLDGKPDVLALKRLVDDCQPVIAVVEDVGSMPGQGVASTFKFGFAAGAITGLLLGLHIPIARYRPAVWKRASHLSADKNASRARATESWPHRATALMRDAAAVARDITRAVTE